MRDTVANPKSARALEISVRASRASRALVAAPSPPAPSSRARPHASPRSPLDRLTVSNLPARSVGRASSGSEKKILARGPWGPRPLRPRARARPRAALRPRGSRARPRTTASCTAGSSSPSRTPPPGSGSHSFSARCARGTPRDDVSPAPRATTSPRVDRTAAPRPLPRARSRVSAPASLPAPRLPARPPSHDAKE